MKRKVLFNCLTLTIILSSCTTPRDVIYFQDAGNYSLYNNVEPFEAKIHKDDLLAIMVNSFDTEAARPFNPPIANYYVGGDTYGQQRLLGYLVDKDGMIDFPALGSLQVEGLTRNQLRDLIKTKLIEEGMLKEPIITISFLNFKVSVQGEVNRPGTFLVTSERITLLEALSMAGDLTIYGKRDRVAVIRESGGTRTMLFHDLTSTELFQSPCYYLQQNDIVYVQPNNRRVQQSNINQNNSATVWLSVVSVLLTTIGVFVNLSKKR